MGCAVHYAEPVEYCIICGHEFSDAERQYNDVIGNEHCRAKYFDRDRINVVEMVYLNALSIFDAGSCLSNCFWLRLIRLQRNKKSISILQTVLIGCITLRPLKKYRQLQPSSSMRCTILQTA